MLSNNCLQFSVYVVILEHVLVKVYTTEKAANMLVNAKHKTYQIKINYDSLLLSFRIKK